MVFHYPNGRAYDYHKNENHPSLVNKVNHRSINHNRSKVIYGNRGMSLEEEINESNQYYLSQGIAVIHKKPIPIQIVSVDYPKRSAAVIKEAYFKQASTTDYNGVYKGKYLDFEAKETTNISSFPLRNFHAHQVEHMRACQKQGGICFTIVKFTKTDELFILPADLLFKYWDEQDKSRKSIPKAEIEQLGYKLNYSISPRIPFLKGVDLLIANS